MEEIDPSIDLVGLDWIWIRFTPQCCIYGVLHSTLYNMKKEKRPSERDNLRASIENHKIINIISSSKIVMFCVWFAYENVLLGWYILSTGQCNFHTKATELRGTERIFLGSYNGLLL